LAVLLPVAGKNSHFELAQNGLAKIQANAKERLFRFLVAYFAAKPGFGIVTVC